LEQVTRRTDMTTAPQRSAARIGWLAAGALAAGLVLTGCGGSYDREAFIDELEEGGVDRELATCIADGAEARLGTDRLDDRGELTAEEQAILAEITSECVLGE
jgi:hypothetical protein